MQCSLEDGNDESALPSHADPDDVKLCFNLVQRGKDALLIGVESFKRFSDVINLLLGQRG